MRATLRWWEVVLVGLAVGYLLAFAMYAARHPKEIAAVVMRWGA